MSVSNAHLLLKFSAKSFNNFHFHFPLDFPFQVPTFNFSSFSLPSPSNSPLVIASGIGGIQPGILPCIALNTSSVVPEHCTGLQSMCTGESQSIALHCNLIARTLGGSGWKSAGARRIQNFGFWPQWPLFLRIRNVGMGWVGGWRWARVALFLLITFNCNLLSLAQHIALSSFSWNDIK